MRYLRFVVAFALAGAAAPARGDVLYNNFGPGDSTGTGNWNVTRGIGVRFTIGPAPMQLDSITLMIGFSTGATTLAVAEDQSGSPGSVLESGVVTPPSGTINVQTYASSSRPLLLAGRSYWVTSTPAAGASHAWRWNNQGVAGFAFLNADGSWGSSNGFTPTLRVNGSPAAIPEPSPPALAAVALALAALVRRARSRGGAPRPLAGG